MQTTLVLLSRDKLQEELARQLSLLAFDIFVNIRVRRRRRRRRHRRSFILCCLAFFFFFFLGVGVLVLMVF
jgi:hypothetical protein